MRFYAQLLWRISLALTTLAIVGCGFHLRGMADVSPWLNNIAIIVQQGHRDLSPLLKNQLQSYKISVNPEPATAQYWLIIEQDDVQRNIMSVSSGTAARQYQLIYTLRFKLQHAKGKDILPSTQVVVTRQITINSDRILGSNEEEALLLNEMRHDAIIQVLNRLSRARP